LNKLNPYLDAVLRSGEGAMPVDDYRRLAGKCLRMAEQATHGTTRAMLRHLGEVWTRLAEEDELAQQQQQNQPKKLTA
jgi:hypothetical protein